VRPLPPRRAAREVERLLQVALAHLGQHVLDHLPRARAVVRPLLAQPVELAEVLAAEEPVAPPAPLRLGAQRRERELVRRVGGAAHGAPTSAAGARRAEDARRRAGEVGGR
jgi:hypothetical protein